MIRCLETDELTALGTVLEWETERKLRHLADCEGCRTRLRQLAAVHHTVSEETQTHPGFVERVMRTLPRDDSATAKVQRSGISLVLNPVLAAATMFFTGALAGSSTAAARPGLALVVASILAAVGTLWWNWTGAGRVKDVAVRSTA